MKKMKIAALLLTAAILITFAGCGGMNTQTGGVSFDVSKAVSRIPSGVETARVWLVAEGTTSFYDLDPDSDNMFVEKSLQSGDETIEIDNIPSGLEYTVYLSLGTGTGVNFVPASTATGPVFVSGDDSLAELTSEAVSASVGVYSDDDLSGLLGVVSIGSTLYTTDGSKVYYGASVSLATDFTASADFGNDINDISKGIDVDAIETVYLSVNASDGHAVVEFTGGSFDSSFSSGLPTDTGMTGTINILASDVFYATEDGETMQAIVSQIDGGLIISVLDATGDTVEWFGISLNDFLASAEISLTGKLIRGLTAVDNRPGEDSASVFLASKVGNFRKTVPWDGSEISEDFGDNFPVSTSPLYLERIFSIGTTSKTADFLYLATSDGLWAADITGGAAVIINETQISVTDDKYVEMLECGANYTACVTPLELVIVENAAGAVASASSEVQVIPFNAGLPAAEKLTDDSTGITDLEWNGNVLYVSGSGGLVKIDAAALFAD